jgi:hypothetical protein
MAAAEYAVVVNPAANTQYFSTPQHIAQTTVISIMRAVADNHHILFIFQLYR